MIACHATGDVTVVAGGSGTGFGGLVGVHPLGTIIASYSTGVVTAQASDTSLALTPVGPGTATVVVTATEDPIQDGGLALSVSMAFRVTVSPAATPTPTATGGGGGGNGGDPQPTPEPTPVPTPEPTPIPTATPEPTLVTTPEPTPEPTQEIVQVFIQNPEQAIKQFTRNANENPQQAGKTLLEIAEGDDGDDDDNASQILLGFARQMGDNDGTVGLVLRAMAGTNPETTGRVLAGSARRGQQTTGIMICAGVQENAGAVGQAMGHSAREAPGSTSGALETVSGDRECVSQLDGVVPVETWAPETPPQEGPGQTGQGVWQDIGSPAPIENILARFTSIISDAKTVITNLDDPPVEAAPLPPDRIPYGFVDLGHENFTNDDVVAAHVTISVEREWLDTNQVHEWSMQFSRFEESTTSLGPHPLQTGAPGRRQGLLQRHGAGILPLGGPRSNRRSGGDLRRGQPPH